MPKDLTGLDFKSKEEFREICQHLGARMHYLNRVSMGESAFAFAMAELLQNAGRVFDEHYDDKDTKAAFGDGYTVGTIAREDRAVALHALMYPPKTEASGGDIEETKAR